MTDQRHTSDIDAVMACYRACATNLLPNGPSHQVLFAASVPLILAAIRAEAVAAERERMLGELSRRYNERYVAAAAEGNSRAGSSLRARCREITKIEEWLRQDTSP